MKCVCVFFYTWGRGSWVVGCAYVCERVYVPKSFVLYDKGEGLPPKIVCVCVSGCAWLLGEVVRPAAVSFVWRECAGRRTTARGARWLWK